MRHFTLDDWTDFARDIVERGKGTAMKSHLEAGCTSCAAVVSLWQRVYMMAGRELAYGPPESVVRHSKATFSLHMASKNRPKRGASYCLTAFCSRNWLALGPAKSPPDSCSMGPGTITLISALSPRRIPTR